MKSRILVGAVVILTVLVLGWSVRPVAGDESELIEVLPSKIKMEPDPAGNLFKTVRDVESYALGYDLGLALKQQQFDIVYDHFSAGLQDALKSAEPTIGLQQLRSTLEALDLQRQQKQQAQLLDRMKNIATSPEFQEDAVENLKEAVAFLRRNTANEQVQTTKSGLQYRIIRITEGSLPTETSTVTVHYKGRLLNGTQFDSTHQRGRPMTWDLAKTPLIPGWVEAIKLMPIGSKFEFYIPPDLAYSDQVKPGIPPNSVLIFELELLDVR